MKKKAIGIISLLLMCSMAATGCNSGNTSANAADATPSNSVTDGNGGQGQDTTASNENITIKVAGSTSVAPLMKELKAEYEGLYPHISVEIQESGSSAGITATIEGAADLGMSSRDLKDAEKETGLAEITIALDGIAVIVNPDNPVSDLTQDQIAGIFKGEITNWNEIGGNDGEIIVVSREEGSGTRGAFEELLKLEEEIERDGAKYTQSLLSDEALFENSTGGVKSNIATSRNAIGYISLGSLDETVKALDVNGVVCSETNVNNKTYSIARPFLLCTIGSPKPGVEEFIGYILSENGQMIVSENGYIAIQ